MKARTVRRAAHARRRRDPLGAIRGSRDGVVLVLVLWVVALLSIAAVALSASARSEMLRARNRIEWAAATEGARGGIERAVLGLRRGGEHGRFVADGKPVELQLGDTSLVVSIVSASTRVDLNRAVPETLIAALRAAGVAPRDRDRLADAIQDWRDEDSLRRLHGAEDTEYLRAGLRHVPANRPFRAVADVRRVLGVDAPTYRAMRPFVTLWGGETVVSTGRVSPALRAALAGGAEPVVSAELASVAPESADRDDTAGDPPVSSSGPFVVRSVAERPGGTRVALEGTVVPGVAGDGADPTYAMLDLWRIPDSMIETDRRAATGSPR